MANWHESNEFFLLQLIYFAPRILWDVSRQQSIDIVQWRSFWQWNCTWQNQQCTVCPKKMSVGTQWLVHQTRPIWIYLHDDLCTRYLQRRTHSRYICLYSKVDRSISLNTSCHVDRSETFCLLAVRSVRRSASRPTITWPPSQFQDRIWRFAKLLAVKWCSRDVQVFFSYACH